LLAVALLPALPGCGDDSRDASVALRSYYQHLEERDWSEACGNLTETARARLTSDFGASCPRALARARPAPDLLSSARIVALRVSGDRARIDVTLTTAGSRQFASWLRKEGGRWLVANPYSPFRRALRDGEQ
jgi:hypothetical protein